MGGAGSIFSETPGEHRPVYESGAKGGARLNSRVVGQAKVLLKMYERKSKEWNQVDAGFSGLGIVQFFGQKGVDGR